MCLFIELGNPGVHRLQICPPWRRIVSPITFMNKESLGSPRTTAKTTRWNLEEGSIGGPPWLGITTPWSDCDRHACLGPSLRHSTSLRSESHQEIRIFKQVSSPVQNRLRVKWDHFCKTTLLNVMEMLTTIHVIYGEFARVNSKWICQDHGNN